MRLKYVYFRSFSFVKVSSDAGSVPVVLKFLSLYLPKFLLQFGSAFYENSPALEKSSSYKKIRNTEILGHRTHFGYALPKQEKKPLNSGFE